ncbi:hypothetical protein GCM10011608_11160 [Micromonospora sonchi]|uniref:Uncharacterized protein n=1 Tax=Micromonospora sonchi TaxID=1763543 RepID=A0A917TMX7_9ACTN|nr:hypothetical protein [Micromonospora sonchi]GGM28066.1 hypothetical protein GCM10011608_11160 [Micromonospora sonchi]
MSTTKLWRILGATCGVISAGTLIVTITIVATTDPPMRPWIALSIAVTGLAGMVALALPIAAKVVDMLREEGNAAAFLRATQRDVDGSKVRRLSSS